MERSSSILSGDGLESFNYYCHTSSGSKVITKIPYYLGGTVKSPKKKGGGGHAHDTSLDTKLIDKKNFTLVDDIP
jgi:hypothetical protein